MKRPGRSRRLYRGSRYIVCTLLFLSELSPAAPARYSAAKPSAQSTPDPGPKPLVLSDGWAIRGVQTNDLGSVAFRGGGYYYGDDYSSSGIADSVALVDANGLRKLAAIGDPVPDRPERVFAGFEYQALNNHDDVAFVALSLPTGDSSNCLQIPWPSACESGVYLYSAGHIRGIAVSGGLAPGAGGRGFVEFGSPRLNDKGMIAFWAYLSVEDSGSEVEGYFLFDGSSTRKVVISGESPPLLGTVGHLNNISLLDQSGAFTFCANGIVARFLDGELSKVFAAGDQITGGGAVPPFDEIVGMSGNRQGDMVFEIQGSELEQSGLYLIRRDGRVIRIISHGDPSPGGARFSMTYTIYNYHIAQMHLSDLKPQINDAGDVLFISPLTGGVSVAGIFLYSGGQIRSLAFEGDPVESNPGLRLTFIATDNYSYFTLLNTISFSPPGRIIFTAWLSKYPTDYSRTGIFQLTGEGASLVVPTDDLVPGIAGEVHYGFVAANALGDMVLLAGITNGTYILGIFRTSLPSPEVPNPGFEVSTQAGFPEHWTIKWTNFGEGEVHEYDSGGRDSFEGKSDLRLQTGATGGAVFVVSDPIVVLPETDYFLQCRMRYNLSGGSDSVYFTVIRLDANGNSLGIDETRGLPGDNFWTWQPKRLLFHTTPDAAFVRIRFGLIAGARSYLDVDAIGGRDGP